MIGWWWLAVNYFFNLARLENCQFFFGGGWPNYHFMFKIYQDLLKQWFPDWRMPPVFELDHDPKKTCCVGVTPLAGHLYFFTPVARFIKCVCGIVAILLPVMKINEHFEDEQFLGFWGILFSVEMSIRNRFAGHWKSQKRSQAITR